MAREVRWRDELTDVLLEEGGWTGHFHIVKVVFFREGYDETSGKSTVSRKVSVEIFCFVT